MKRRFGDLQRMGFGLVGLSILEIIKVIGLANGRTFGAALAALSVGGLVAFGIFLVGGGGDGE